MTFAALIFCAMGVGTFTLQAFRLPRDCKWEFWALSCAAGLGLLAVGLGLLGLAGALKWSRWLVPLGAIITFAWFVRSLRFTDVRNLRRPSFGVAVVALMAAAAFFGAIAPVTDSDSLAYPIPIAQQLTREGVWRFWPSMARSVYPLSQEFLQASLLGLGNQHLGLVSALELAVSAVLIVTLASRVSSQPAAGWVAAVIALGCPAVAFLAGSAKEDLLLIMMTVSAAIALNLPAAPGAVAAAGLFAGLAAGAKYTGLPVALGIVACVPFCCGRERRYQSLALAALVALAVGGIWYAVNLVRFGNPMVPFMPSIGHFPVSEQTATDWLSGYGAGNRPLDFLLVPFRMSLEVLRFEDGNFGGRGNWINPLFWLGVPWIFLNRRRWRALLPLLVISASLYVTWFSGMQIARLLLPSVALLSIPAAEALLWARSRFRLFGYALAVALVLSAGFFITVGGMRSARYFADRQSFLDRETSHFDAIQWMNNHLDPGRDRVATHLASGYLRIPWMNLGSDYQVEINPRELDDPARLYLALKRQGFTHVFCEPNLCDRLEPWLVPVYSNPDSRLGGARFFRPPPTVPVVVFVLK